MFINNPISPAQIPSLLPSSCLYSISTDQSQSVHHLFCPNQVIILCILPMSSQNTTSPTHSQSVPHLYSLCPIGILSLILMHNLHHQYPDNTHLHSPCPDSTHLYCAYSDRTTYLNVCNHNHLTPIK